MNISSEKFNIIVNVDEIDNKDLKQNFNDNSKDSTQISDLDICLNDIDSGQENDRLEKINEIKRKIENNTYRIDSTDLAKKIIQRTKGGALIES